MKFTVKRALLKDVLQKINGVIASRPSLPIMGNVMLHASEGKLVLTTTNTDFRISARILATVQEAGATTVPAKKLSALAGCFVGEDIKFEADERDHVKIECGTSQFTLLGMPAANFPDELVIEPKREIILKQSELKNTFGAVSYAASTDDSRRVLTGILVSVHESKLAAVATDGKRLAMQELTLKSVTGEDGDVVVPLQGALVLRGLLDGDSEVTVKIGEKVCLFDSSEFSMSCKLIEGHFPEFRKVIPTEITGEATIPTSECFAKIETIRLVLKDTSSYIMLRFDEGKLELQGASAEIGDGVDSLSIKYTGAPFEACFNPIFLADPLRNVGTETIRMKFKDAISPFIIEAGDGFLYVVMPVRHKSTN